jgi:predicted Fe-Mo cluster-binding NifX family protein
MKVCVPVSADGAVDPRWGRAERVAVAEVVGGELRDWQEHDVGWGTLHDEGTEGAHHARIARFLRDNGIDAVAAEHVGPGMQRMLDSMAVRLVTGVSGDARTAAVSAASSA